MKKLIVANWKCNPVTSQEARRLFLDVQRVVAVRKGPEVVICPPYPYLVVPRECLKPEVKHFKLGGQDCFWQEEGAFTGEVSAKMLKNIGCEYVIVGHSERRRYFGETNETVNKKIKAVMDVGLKPIMCVGETKEERENGQAAQVILSQLKEGLRGIKPKEVGRMLVAYEPVWAIGSGSACSSEEAMSAGLLIRRTIISMAGQKRGNEIPILYGGSVTHQNAADYVKEAGLRGLLVGGASLNANEFLKIIRAVG